MLKKIIKKILNKFNYRIISNKDWGKKVENLVVEAPENDLQEFQKVDEISLTSLPNKWCLMQSLNHIKENDIEGDIVETGVYKGANLILINNFLSRFQLKKKIYAFDTYSGQPEPTEMDYDLKGTKMIDKFKEFKKKDIIPVLCSLDEVKKNIKNYSSNDFRDIIFIKGKVEDTLLNENNLPTKISLLRLDTDFHDSIKKSLEILYPRLSNGGVLIIDDYGHFKGAKVAVDNYFKDKKNIWMHRVDYTCRLIIKP